MQSLCRNCGTTVESDSTQCPQCGTIPDTFVYKSRIAAATLAIFGGIFGAHRFFLGQWWGIFYLLFCWTYIPAIIGLIEGIVILATSQRNWNEKHNQGVSVGTERGVIVVIMALMIPAISMLGILAAVALPAYQDYTIRAKLNEAYVAANPIKEAVAEHVTNYGQWPASAASMSVDMSPRSKMVSDIRVEDGVVYITVSAASGTEGDIIFVPTVSDVGISWSCTQSTVASKYLPPSCRDAE